MKQNNVDSSRTRNGQEEQDHVEYQYQDNNNYYNIITTRTQACPSAELPGNEVMERIADAYKANIAPTITQAAATIIEQALKGGMEPEAVIMAVEETGLASRPSPYYLRAVLRNWAEWGIVSSRTRNTNTKTQARPWWR